MTKEQLSHLIRVAVIVLLLAAAVILCWQSGYFSGLGERLRPAAETDVQEDMGTLQLSAAEKAAFVHPETVLLRQSSAATAAAQYSEETLRSALQTFAPVLGEALGTAGTPEHISEDSFRSGLAANCVFMRFPCPIQLQLLADWLGSEMVSAGADMRIDMLYLSLAEENVQLRFRDSTGQYFRCATAAMSESLLSRIGEVQGYDAVFAFEDAKLHTLAPYTVVLREMPRISAVQSAAVHDGIDAAELLRAVGMNSFVSSSYTEADGTRVFVQDDMTLRLGADGILSFRLEAQPTQQYTGQGLLQAVNYACALVTRIVGDKCGDAILCFTGAEFSVSDRQYTVSFDYCVDAVPVVLPGGHAAQIVLQNGSLAEMRLDLRRYTLNGEPETLLPMPQAAAILNAGEGGALALQYSDGGDSVPCMWVRAS